jgi:hypothetical protein
MIILLALGITSIMFCGVGVLVCLGVFADKLDDILRGVLNDED